MDRTVWSLRIICLPCSDELAKVNEKWGLTRGVSVVESGARHRSTEEYRRWLANACVTLEAQLENNSKLLKSLNEELAIAQKKQKSFTTMIDNLKTEKDRLEDELRPLRAMQANSESISAEIARKIQNLEYQKAQVEAKLADKERSLMRLTGCLKLFVKIRLTSSSKPGNWKTRPISLNFHGLIT